MDLLKGFIGPIAKAVAGAATILVLAVVAWFAKQAGVPIDMNPESVAAWIQTAVAALLTGAAVYWQKNHPAS